MKMQTPQVLAGNQAQDYSAGQNPESKIAIVLPNQSKFYEVSQNGEIPAENTKVPGDFILTSQQALQQQQQPVIARPAVCNQEALDALQKRTGYPISQENGQRKYGPPPNWEGVEPSRACEVFVGKIPRDCFEDELVPILERAGEVYEFRLMMDYSGYNRGFGFVMYTSREHVKKAVSELNNYEIRKNRMIGLCQSVDNCRLFVGGIPKNKKREEILEEMKKVTEDVINVIVYPSANDKSKNRGFAFVQYTNHRAAAVARRKLISAKTTLFGQAIAVDWAEPEPEVDDDVMKTVKVLYVRNLMLTTTEEFIKNEFEKIKPNSVERVKKLKDFAFVHFKERDDALTAMKQINGSTIDGALVEVTLSKPVDKNNYMRFTRQNVSPTNSLLSTCFDPNDINILLNAQSLSGISSPHTAAIPAFPQTVTFTDPATNLQYQIPNQHFQTLNLPMQNFMPNSNIPNLHNLQPQIISQNQLLGNLVPDQSSLVSKPGSRLRNIPGSRGAGGIHRSAYYNTIKGVNGGVKRQLSNEDALHDLYAGVKPVPMLPLNPAGFKYPTKPPSQVLEEFCLKEGIPPPIYTLHTTNGKDQEGREIGLYLYKVMLPTLFNGNQLTSNRLMRNYEDAKNDAAEFVLMQLFPQNMNELNDAQCIEKVNTQVYPSQTNQQQISNNINGVGSSVQPQLVNAANKNVISPNDQNNLIQQSNVAPMIPGTSNEQHIVHQYILDPSGQYLIYPTPGWQ